jgi:hypothetical protein
MFRYFENATAGHHAVISVAFTSVTLNNLPDYFSNFYQGSWAPSVNMSTLLTTIRLLMAHPNPDDGLMPEIVRNSTLKSIFRLVKLRFTCYQTELYRKDPAQFAANALASTLKHACRSPVTADVDDGHDGQSSSVSPAPDLATESAPRFAEHFPPDGGAFPLQEAAAASLFSNNQTEDEYEDEYNEEDEVAEGEVLEEEEVFEEDPKRLRLS